MELKEKILDFVNIYKVNLIVGGMLFILIIGGNLTIYYLLSQKVINNNSNNSTVALHYEEVKEKVNESKLYKVDIKGAILNPGVYELDSDSRIIDVINLAGGLLELADTSVTNLSKYIQDEMVIVIYTKDEVLNFKEVKEEEQIEEKQCIIYNTIIENNSCKENNIDSSNNNDNVSNDPIDTKISLNKADIELLMTLPGIGESKAKSIIEYRETNGKFNVIEDILNISGIGEKLFGEIKEFITV